MKKLTTTLFIILAIMAIGCSASRSSLTKSYTVSAVEKKGTQSVVKIKGLTGRYILNSDTLKVNDQITITWINRYK